MGLLRTNSSKTTFEESLVKFKQHLRIRSYPKTVIQRSLSARPSVLTQNANERIYVPPSSEQPETDTDVTMEPLLKTIYLKPPIISYKSG